MAARVAKGSSSSSSNSSQVSLVSVQEKGSRNKRKFRADPPLGDPTKLPSSSHLSYEFSAEKSQNTPPLGHGHSACDLCCIDQYHPDVLKSDLGLPSVPGSTEVGSSQPRGEIEANELQDADWSDLTESQLEELVLNNLDTIFKSAIKKIAACGYSEEVATKAVLRSGLCYGSKDTVSNIVDNTLAFLRNGQEVDASRDHFFEDLQQLEKYILAEMVCVLREVRPSFKTGDAMWCLLICDMNVSHACAMEGDPLITSESSGRSSSVSTLPRLKSGANSSELNLNPNKPNPSFHCAYSSPSNTPTVAGIPNFPNPSNSLVLEGFPPEKEPVSTSDNAEKFSGVNEEHIQTTSQSSGTEVKLGGGRKGHSSSFKREYILRQNSFHMEKNDWAYESNGDQRTGKLNGLGGLILDKELKSVSDSTVINLKNGCLSKAVGVDVPQTDENHNLSISAGLSTPSVFDPKTVNTKCVLSTTTTPSALPITSALSALPTANTDLSLSLLTKSNTTPKPLSCNGEAPHCSYAGIPYDKSLAQWVPQDKKDEMLRKLVLRLQELQNQLQEWTEWGNHKVMQAARRLSKDKDELKTLRQEKVEVERLKKEKQTLEENAMKKHSELENAFWKARGQEDRANSTVHRLEVENSELRQDMEVAKLQAAVSAASCQEASEREKKTLQKFQTWERQKNLFQNELLTEKHKLDQLQQELEQAKDLQDQFEARRKQEEKAKEELLMQTRSIRKEREQIEALAKSEEDLIGMKAVNDLQRYKDDIQKLENEISQLRLKTDSSKIAALRRGIDGSYASRLTDGNSISTLKGTHTPYISQLVADFPDYWGNGDVKRERECVMCLSEEMSVVFLPCAHQVVCTKCNDFHEKQGMKDCPSCRTPIQRRICVHYYAHS